MKTVTATPSLVLPLGRMGENEYTRIQFDVSGWLAELPAATIGLYNQRPQDADAYPVDGITVENGIVTWTITSAELAQVGKGRCELVAIQNNVVAKSAIYNTIVFDALDGSGEAPDPWDSWQETFVQLKAEAVQAAQDAEEATEHYPRIVDGIWQVWDVQTGAWVSTGVHATGADGQDGADGVSPTVSVTDISGGHRVTITDAEGQHVFDVMNGTDGQDGYSPTVTVTDITGGHRVTITDADGAHTFDVMDGTGSVQDVQVNGTSVVQDGVANVPKATNSALGVVRAGNSVGTTINGDGAVCIAGAVLSDIKAGTQAYKPIVPAMQHQSAFYGMATAAGDATQKASSNPVGTYTDDAKSAIRTMLGAGKVDDVQVNGVSVLDAQGVANVPVASTNNVGVLKISNGTSGIYKGANDHILYIATATDAHIKSATNTYRPITPSNQHSSAFYGFAKAAGDSTQSASSNAVGTYTDNAKDKIQQMIGIIDMIAPHEEAQASQAYSIGKAFVYAGKLYKATAAIASGDAIVPNTNCTQTTLAEMIGG